MYFNLYLMQKKDDVNSQKKCSLCGSLVSINKKSSTRDGSDINLFHDDLLYDGFQIERYVALG